MLNNADSSSQKQKLIVYIFLTIATLAVFWQVNHYDFINLDDPGYITENSRIQSGVTLDGICWAFSTKDTGIWNPLIWLSFMLDYQFYGLNAGGYHLTNLILHILSALMLFWFFNRMTKKIWPSAFVAAFFALHPLHVESVAWIAERKDVLSAFFWMLTLCLYVYYTEKPAIKRYLPVLLCFVCALMSKPMVITLPVIMILLDYWPLDRLESQKTAKSLTDVMPVSINKGQKKTKSKKEVQQRNISSVNNREIPQTGIAGMIPSWQLWEKIPFFILSAVVVVITLYAPVEQEASLKNFPLNSRLANAPVAFMTYLEKTFLPHDLAILYPFSGQTPIWQTLGAALLILVISIIVIAAVKRMPYLFAGWLWYAITILPVIGIIQISSTAPCAMADRYHYLPSIGIAMMLAWGIPSLMKREETRKKILFPAGIAFLIVMSILAWKQCRYWENNVTLFTHTLQVTKNNDLIHDNLGITLFHEGKIKEAIEHYSEAIRITPNYAYAYYHRGNAYAGLGQYQPAIENLTEAIRLKPDYAAAYNNRGNIYARLGQHQRAIENLTEAIRLKPDYAGAYYNRGNAYGRLGQYQPAIENFTDAIRLKPDYADAYNNRGNIYLIQGNVISGCTDAQNACSRGVCITLGNARQQGYCR